MDPVIVIHGGAWAIPDSLAEASISGVKLAVEHAWEILYSGGSALDAVESAVRMLEDDPTFDAGTGAVLTLNGEVELDAMIMDGKDLRCGAVACVQSIKNPVSLARLVMEKTNHVMLVGKGANAFAEEQGIKIVPREELVTPEAIKQWQLYRKYKSTVTSLFSDRNGHHDTVGCVAMDKTGALACATSTGGITAKRPGRVGDSPLVGSGGYADNLSAAVSCTGHGESIAKVCLAKAIADGCAQGLRPNESLKKNLVYMSERVGGAGGAICIDKTGQCAIAFTTQRMAWAIKSKNKSSCGLNPEDYNDDKR